MENDYEYSQNAIQNVNRLIKSLKNRIATTESTTDKYENIVYVDCDIFSTDVLVSALAESLSLFNLTPLYSEFNFDDSSFIDEQGPLLVEGALIILKGTKSLIETGKKEFKIEEDGINFVLPTFSELTSTQWISEIDKHSQKIKEIKSQ